VALCAFFFVFPEYTAVIDEETIIKEISLALKPEILEKTESVETKEKKDDSIAPTTIKISVAGDCTLGFDERRGYDDSFLHEFARQKKEFAFFFQKVQHIFAESDLSLVNLEGALTNAEEHVDKPFVFRGPPEFARILSKGNIDAVNLANNHAFDYLVNGYRDTLKALNWAGIGYFGNGEVYSTAIKGLNITLLGFTRWEAEWSEEWILTEIREAKLNADLVIVSFHWGDEKSYLPNELQRKMGRLCIENGADLVWGHHPHVLQGIEKYQGRYIVYSLGNFSYGGHRYPDDRDTMIFQQIFEFTDDALSRVDYKIIPCSVSSIEERNNFQPIPLTGEEAERVMLKIEDLTNRIGE